MSTVAWAGDTSNCGPELHTATIVVPARPLPVGMRRPELFQLPDIAATLAGLLELELPDTVWGRDALVSVPLNPPTVGLTNCDWPCS